MNAMSIDAVVNGNIEALDDGVELILALTDTQYITIVEEYASSSIGQHLRHVVDMFMAVLVGGKLNKIDYNLRRRGALIETDRKQALVELADIRQLMKSLSVEGLDDEGARIQVLTEVSSKEMKSVNVESTLVRELIFVGSHAVHHYALIGILAKLQGVPVKNGFGVAPATATYLRENNEVVESLVSP